MKRPESHEIDTHGKTQHKLAFESLGWTVNPVENDYGTDFEVEVFRNQETTGLTFKIQLKSSRSTVYSSDGTFVSQSIERHSGLYMCRELRTPILLVHADVVAKRTFWVAPQLDQGAIQQLIRPDCGSITFRMPTANELPGSWEKLLETIGHIETLLALRALSEQPIPDFLSSIRHRSDKDQISRDLKNRSVAIEIERANDLLGRGSLEEARARLEYVLRDPLASVELRFWALLSFEFVEMRVATERRTLEEEQANVRLYISRQLKGITKKGPPHLKFMAILSVCAAELNVLTARDWAIFLNWQLNQDNGDVFWRSHLAAVRARLTRQIVAKFGQCLRVVNIGVNSPTLVSMLGQAIPRMIVAIAPFVQRLRQEGLNEAAQTYSSRMLALCQLASIVAEATQDDNALRAIAHRAALLAAGTSCEFYKWALEMAGKLKDPEERQRLIRDIQEHGERCDNAARAEITIADEQRFYEAMAASLGVDLSNETDTIAEAVRIGIADLDPTRVLKNCKHLFVSIESQSIVGKWLRLPTLGTKVLHCKLHRYGIGGGSLDGVYEVFKETHCKSCGDVEPRPSDWSYSHAWQRAENERIRRAGLLNSLFE